MKTSNEYSLKEDMVKVEAKEKAEASLLAIVEIKRAEEKNNLAITKAEEVWMEAKMSAVKYASRVEAELLSKALTERRTRESEAKIAFARMQESIELKRQEKYEQFSLK